MSTKSEPTNEKRIGKYQIGEALGKGAFGVVYKGLDFDTGETVAIKRLELKDISTSELNNVEQEIQLLQKMDHPNIVHYIDCIRSESHLNIVLEFIENGSLLAIIKKFGKFPETLTSIYISQMLEGLAYLHGQGVIHRDIKAANMLTTKDGMVKLADFGVATLSKTRMSGNFNSDNILGSPYWMAPELIQMESSDTPSDLWSLGCTIIELMTGDPPFYHMPQLSAMYHIAESTTPPPYPEGISKALEDFLNLCFVRDPTERATADQLLNHQWITNVKNRKGGVGTDRVHHKVDTPRSEYSNGKDDESPKRFVLRTESSQELGIGNSIEEMTVLEDQLDELRQQVVIEVRNNLLLESNLKKLDKKIALLIRNRISIQEVIRSQKSGRVYSKSDTVNDVDGKNVVLKWKSGNLKEGYSKLFHMLQVNPKYLTSFMFFQFEGSEQFIDTLILTLFGFAFSPREEYLFLRLFESAIQREINNITSIQSFSDEAAVLLRMILAYNRRVQEQDFLRKLLGQSIEDVIKKDDNLEYDYKKVYSSIISQQETQTGEIDQKLDPDATDQEILNNPKVKAIVHKRVDLVLETVDVFFIKILKSVNEFPYGLRMIARWLKQALLKKFPDSEDSIYVLLGYIIYYRFMNPAIILPEDYEMSEPLNSAQRVNLARVSRLLSNITTNQLLTETSEEIQRLNKYIQDSNKRFKQFLTDLTEGLEEPAEYLKIDSKYLEYTITHSPVIYISPNEMFLTHKYLLEHIDKLVPSQDDELRKLLFSLQEPLPVIPNETILESEIALTLQPSFSLEDEKKGNSKSSRTNKLYSTTKKLICGIIRDAYRDSLSKLDLFELLTGPEASGNSKLTQTVGRILENLEKLEKKGICKKSDHYNSVLEDIQSDIWKKQSVKDNLLKERDNLKTTLERLKEKKIYLEDQLSTFNTYVKACLEQSVSSLKKKGKGSGKKKKTKNSTKYSCSQLVKKGVIAEIGVPSSQYSTVAFRLKETEMLGVFSVKVLIAGIVVETITIELDDLLEKQDNGTYIFELMDGRVKLRVNLLIHLLNKLALM